MAVIWKNRESAENRPTGSKVFRLVLICLKLDGDFLVRIAKSPIAKKVLVETDQKRGEELVTPILSKFAAMLQRKATPSISFGPGSAIKDLKGANIPLCF